MFCIKLAVATVLFFICDWWRGTLARNVSKVFTQVCCLKEFTEGALSACCGSPLIKCASKESGRNFWIIINIYIIIILNACQMEIHQSSPRSHFFFEMVEWSEQLRSVTTVWLGAIRHSVQIQLCTSGCKSEKMFGVISPPCDLFLSTVHQLYNYTD